MNETIRIVNIVCDNVRRTLSRYLHIEGNVKTGKFPQKRLDAIGGTLDGFNEKLRKSMKVMGDFLEHVRREEGDGTMVRVDIIRSFLFIKRLFILKSIPVKKLNPHFICRPLMSRWFDTSLVPAVEAPSEAFWHCGDKRSY